MTTISRVEDIEMRCASIAAVWTLRLPVEYFQYRGLLEKTMFNAGKGIHCIVGEVTIDDVIREFNVNAQTIKAKIGMAPVLKDICSQKFKLLSQFIHRFRQTVKSLGFDGHKKFLDVSSDLAVSQEGFEKRKDFALVIEDMFVGLFDLHILTKIIFKEQGDIAVVAGYEHLGWISTTMGQLGLRMQRSVQGLLEREHFDVLA